MNGSGIKKLVKLKLLVEYNGPVAKSCREPKRTFVERKFKDVESALSYLEHFEWYEFAYRLRAALLVRRDLAVVAGNLDNVGFADGQSSRFSTDLPIVRQEDLDGAAFGPGM